MKRKLELTWVGKEERPRLEPRLLVEEDRWGDEGAEPNLLIQGDNLLALKALEAEYAGRVKCIFIDPPYNTGSAFEHYDDGLEHSIWLSMMRDRLEVIRNLLSEYGSLWVTLDDNEAHYFKVMADEVFGRSNFVANVVWQKKYTVANDARYLSDNHDHVMAYARSKDNWKPNRLPRSDEMNARYSNPDGHRKGVWKATPLHAKSGSAKGQRFSYTFKNGYVWSPPAGTFPRYSVDTLRRLDDDDEIWFGAGGKSGPSRKTFLEELTSEGPPAPTLWLHSDVGHNHEARDEVKVFNPSDPFATPKPERLIQRIVTIATNPGDLVLDSFAGSGTTGAVAQKMGRRWIMVEIGDHARTHIVPRLQKVIAGEDPGGVTTATGWQGGGSFRFCRLAPSLIARDRWGREVIAAEYGDADLLAQALCKLEGFRFEPSETEWWIHGRSSETDFLHTTTQALSHAQLAELAELVGEGRSLLVLCGAWRGDASAFPNLDVRKIPDHVLKRCDWGQDSYALPETIEAAE